MKERPILFSAAMVQALLDGRKTQTRRIAKLPCPVPAGDWYADRYNGTQEWGIWQRVGGADTGRLLSPELMTCPYGQPGDRLWVRETFLLDPSCDAEEWDTATIGYHSWADLRTPALMPDALRTQDNVIYAASWEGRPLKWQPSIHMPRWASRLTLEITAIRLERLHAIKDSVMDALAEGLVQVDDHIGPRYGVTAQTLKCRTAWSTYASLWNDINGPGAWDLNPYVWVVEFKVMTP